MNRTILLALTGLLIAGIDRAAADNAPFGCDARAAQTCMFRLFVGPRSTRNVQLLPGMKVTIPGVSIGHDSYCLGVSYPPANKCPRKLINATYNN